MHVSRATLPTYEFVVKSVKKCYGLLALGSIHLIFRILVIWNLLLRNKDFALPNEMYDFSIPVYLLSTVPSPFPIRTVAGYFLKWLHTNMCNCYNLSTYLVRQYHAAQNRNCNNIIRILDSVVHKYYGIDLFWQTLEAFMVNPKAGGDTFGNFKAKVVDSSWS